MHRLGHAALAAGKRVRSETNIGQGNLSVVSMALREASAHLGGLAGRAILIAGAGDTGELVLKHLAKDPSQPSGADHRDQPDARVAPRHSPSNTV